MILHISRGGIGDVFPATMPGYLQLDPVIRHLKSGTIRYLLNRITQIKRKGILSNILIHESWVDFIPVSI
jgi:hypothetical protein